MRRRLALSRQDFVARLEVIDAEGWDGPAGTALLDYVRVNLVRIQVTSAGLTGPAGQQAEATGWAVAWETLRAPGLRSAQWPWSVLWTAVRRAVRGEWVAGTAFDQPVRRAIVVELVPAPLVVNAVSLHSALLTIARVLGSAVAGIAIESYGFAWCFGLDAISYVPMILALLRLKHIEMRIPPGAARARRQIRSGIVYAWRMKEIRTCLIAVVVISALAVNFNVMVPLLVAQGLGGGSGEVSLYFAILSCGSLVGALLVARLRGMTLTRVLVAGSAFGLTWLVAAAMPTVTLAVVVAMLVGVTSIAFISSSTALVQLASSPEMRGRVMALQSIALFGTSAIGAPILGFVSDQLGVRSAVALGALASIMVCTVALAHNRRSATAIANRPPV